MTRRKAFTLIELMLVVIIIGALAAMVVPRLAQRGRTAKIKIAKADVTMNIATGLKLFELDNDRFPSTDDGLGVLMKEPSWAINWQGPYLEREPLDPWQREYRYKCPGTHGPDYDLYSLGPDGVESEDDIGNW